MCKVYLLGGESVRRRDGEVVNRAAFDAAGGSPRVLVFSWARGHFDQTYLRQKLVYEYLRHLGASSVVFVDYSLSLEELRAEMGWADVVYLTGGSVSILVERLKCRGVDVLLREFEGVLIGRSAGALALCRRCLVTVRSSGQMKAVEGLGLVDVTMKAHYTRKKDEQIKCFSLDGPVFAVPRGSALVYNELEGLSCINRVYLFENGARQKYLPDFVDGKEEEEK